MCNFLPFPLPSRSRRTVAVLSPVLTCDCLTPLSGSTGRRRRALKTKLQGIAGELLLCRGRALKFSVGALHPQGRHQFPSCVWLPNVQVLFSRKCLFCLRRPENSFKGQKDTEDLLLVQEAVYVSRALVTPPVTELQNIFAVRLWPWPAASRSILHGLF